MLCSSVQWGRARRDCTVAMHRNEHSRSRNRLVPERRRTGPNSPVRSCRHAPLGTLLLFGFLRWKNNISRNRFDRTYRISVVTSSSIVIIVQSVVVFSLELMSSELVLRAAAAKWHCRRSAGARPAGGEVEAAFGPHGRPLLFRICS